MNEEKNNPPPPHSITVREGISARFILHVRHDGDAEQLDEGKGRDADGGRISWTHNEVTGWSMMHVRLVLRDKKSERVFTLVPAPGAKERIELGEFYLKGEFEVQGKENNARRARALWKQVK